MIKNSKILLQLCFLHGFQNSPLIAAKETKWHKINLEQNEARSSVGYTLSTPKRSKKSNLPPVNMDRSEITHRIAKLSIPFICNTGQTNKKVKYYARTFGGNVFITKDGEIVYSLVQFGNI